MKAFKENIENAGQVGNSVNDMAEASNEQARGIEQMNEAVSQINQVIQDTAATAEESASAAEEMNTQAETMRAHVTELVVLMGNGGRDEPRAMEKRPAAPAPPLRKRPQHLQTSGMHLFELTYPFQDKAAAN